MAFGQSYPVPGGVGATFSNVQANATTATFTLDAGPAIATFQAFDPNNPGTVTLYTSAGVSVLTMAAPGYADFIVPVGGGSYYFTTTAAANLLAGTTPNSFMLR